MKVKTFGVFFIIPPIMLLINFSCRLQHAIDQEDLFRNVTALKIENDNLLIVTEELRTQVKSLQRELVLCESNHRRKELDKREKGLKSNLTAYAQVLLMPTALCTERTTKRTYHKKTLTLKNS